jgi:hypothetical protein
MCHLSYIYQKIQKLNKPPLVTFIALSQENIHAGKFEKWFIPHQLDELAIWLGILTQGGWAATIM